MSRPLTLHRITVSITLTVGALSVLLVSGFVIGKKVYGTVQGTKRVGFSCWCKIYQLPLYLGSETQGYEYSEIESDHWIRATLESIDDDDTVWFEDGTMITNFARSDGFRFSVPVRWIRDYDIIPRIGGEYRLKIRLTLKDDGGIRQLLNVNEETLQWHVSEEVLNVKSAEAEQDEDANAEDATR